MPSKPLLQVGVRPSHRHKAYYDVRVYGTTQRMQRAEAEICRSHGARPKRSKFWAMTITFEKPEKDGRLGYILYGKRTARALHCVAHESAHAAINYCRIINGIRQMPSQSGPKHEKVANVFESLVYWQRKAFVKRFGK